MPGLLMLLLAVVVIALIIVIADVVMRRVGVEPTVRWLVDLAVAIIALVLVWPYVGR